jgi:hypothetical protein
MAGLLDSKTRVIDAKLTARGKASIVNGGFEVKYISFSDAGAVYEDNGEGVAVEPLPIGLEVFSTPSDEITVSTDALGNATSFEGAGFILRPDGTVSGKAEVFFESGSLISFKNQRLISTKNALVDDPGLGVSPGTHSFTVSDTAPFDGEPSVSSVDDVESLFSDRRLSKSIRFQYLPPVQRTISTVGNEAQLGEYIDVREESLTDEEIEGELSLLQTQKFTFTKYTKQNEVCMQLFESSSAGLVKLDIVKYGELQERTTDGKQRSLYFVGKIYDDGFDNPTFVNIFDLVLE